MPDVAEVPELHAVVLAHARMRQVEVVGKEAADTLALACWAASKIANVNLIASTIGVTPQRVSQLKEKGRLLAGENRPRRPNKRRKPTWRTPQKRTEGEASDSAR